MAKLGVSGIGAQPERPRHVQSDSSLRLPSRAYSQRPQNQSAYDVKTRDSLIRLAGASSAAENAEAATGISVTSRVAGHDLRHDPRKQKRRVCLVAIKQRMATVHA